MIRQLRIWHVYLSLRVMRLSLRWMRHYADELDSRAKRLMTG